MPTPILGGGHGQIGYAFPGIATNKGDIEQTTGIAFSGEVEDMLLHRIYPPKGEKYHGWLLTGETKLLSFTSHPKERSLRRQYQCSYEQSSAFSFDKQGQVLTAKMQLFRPEGTYRWTVLAMMFAAFYPNADFSELLMD